MRGAGVYRARRSRTDGGLHYELSAEGAPVLAWTLHPFRLGEDVLLRDPDGDPVLRITAEDRFEYVEAPFAVVDERADEVVGHVRLNLRSLVRRHWGLLDPHGVEVGEIAAASRLRSVVRRRWLRFVPYRYAIRDADGDRLGDLRGSIRPGRAFALRGAGAGSLDRRLLLGACAVVEAAAFW